MRRAPRARPAPLSIFDGEGQGVRPVPAEWGDVDAGGYRSLHDFVRRTKLASRLVENLISVGAFDDFGLTRRELLWQLGLFHRARGPQPALPLPTAQDQIALPAYSAWEEMLADYAVLDLSPEHHPLALVRRRIDPSILSSRTLEPIPDGASVRVAGMIVCRQRPGTAHGILFVLLEDEFGLTNVVVYPRLFEAQRNLIRREPFVVVSGRLQRRHGTLNVVAQAFAPLRPRGNPSRGELLAPPSHDFH